MFNHNNKTTIPIPMRMILLAFIFLLPTLAIAQKEALIVGVSDYKGEQADLPGVKKDVIAMTQLFRGWGFHVTTITEAQSMQLEQYLSRYAGLNANDHFIFYYSGHGSHLPDVNDDEDDGEDEALVLSDGKTDKLFLDDALFGYLNAIQAKKMIVFDSCHSGTAFKTFGNKVKAKTMQAKNVDGIIQTKAFRPQQSKINSDNYIVFSAAQDTEESLDSAEGGLFTRAFYARFQDKKTQDIRLMNLKRLLVEDIKDHCDDIGVPPYHPKLSASTKKLKYTTTKAFLDLQTIPIIPIVKKRLSLTGKKILKQGELVTFTINTHSNSGYLTIFSMENGEPFIMFQSKQSKQGVFNFQKDFSIKPPIEAYKNCSNCKQENSRIYVILSAKPPTKKSIKNIELMKAFRQQSNTGTDSVMTYIEFVIE